MVGIILILIFFLSGLWEFVVNFLSILVCLRMREIWLSKCVFCVVKVICLVEWLNIVILSFCLSFLICLLRVGWLI